MKNNHTSYLTFAFCLFALAGTLDAKSQRTYWQQAVNYKIDVTLDDAEHGLDGFVKIKYSNHSPDTLRFIWFHVWPNAYKNDMTAFSDQLLENGRTDFYFSNRDQRGYINGLDFRVGGQIARTEDHPEYIDIVKLLLPAPLSPGETIEISTPFHEKLPDNFSRGGHTKQSYQVTQWYPKPAVYDRHGWHPMPYLDQGEFYSEYGDYEVNITLPKNYVVAATGELQNEDEKVWLATRSTPVSSDTGIKTLTYKQNDVHDFAWFADKHFLVMHDTVQFPSGHVVDTYSFYLPLPGSAWKKSLAFTKNAIRYYSDLVGTYPYRTVSIVEAQTGFDGGMEYPTITCISPMTDENELASTVLHEVGHNWFYGILGSNERQFAWMDEGINTYYENRYKQSHTAPQKPKGHQWLTSKFLDEQLVIETLEKTKTDQAINTPSADFTETNYYLFPYQKAAQWMSRLADSLGIKLFDGCMQAYFESWQFRHPYPEDLKTILEEKSGRPLDSFFALLSKKGPLASRQEHKKIGAAWLFPHDHTGKINYINLGPAIGYNLYDHFMIGALIHNYNLPPATFQFLLAPLYATGSKQLNGIGTINYTFYPDNHFQKITLGLNGARFSSLSGTDSNGHEIFGGFYKVAPSLRFTFRNKSARSSVEKWIEFKTFLIGEKSFAYSLKTADTLFYPSPQSYQTRYLNQLSFNIEHYRALYPYSAQAQVQQGSNFYRVNFTGNYFFNYAKDGGLNIRLFAAKFGYIGEKTISKQLETTNYQPKLTASRGNEDYTYSNYFIGRNESTGFPGQQIMMKDGELKLRTDLFQDLQGRSDDWVAAMNFNSSLPNKLFPIKLPVKIFFDLGTYAGAWKSNPPTSRFLYVGGLQVSLLKGIVNIYVPLFYSADFSNSLKTVPDENSFWKKISFSIDVQHVNFRKIFSKIP